MLFIRFNCSVFGDTKYSPDIELINSVLSLLLNLPFAIPNFLTSPITSLFLSVKTLLSGVYTSYPRSPTVPSIIILPLSIGFPFTKAGYLENCPLLPISSPLLYCIPSIPLGFIFSISVSLSNGTKFITF